MSKFVCISCWVPDGANGAQWHNGEGPLCKECHSVKSKPVGAVPIFKDPKTPKGKK